MTLTLLSSNVVAYWRRVISSNLGCFQVPLGVCSCGACGVGVCGVAGAAMERAIVAALQSKEVQRVCESRSLSDCGLLSLSLWVSS